MTAGWSNHPIDRAEQIDRLRPTRETTCVDGTSTHHHPSHIMSCSLETSAAIKLAELLSPFLIWVMRRIPASWLEGLLLLSRVVPILLRLDQSLFNVHESPRCLHFCDGSWFFRLCILSVICRDIWDLSSASTSMDASEYKSNLFECAFDFSPLTKCLIS